MVSLILETKRKKVLHKISSTSYVVIIHEPHNDIY